MSNVPSGSIVFYKPVSLQKYFVALGKDSVIYGFGNAVLIVLGILTAPILTRIFTPSDYGVLSLIGSVISFVSLLLIFGMDSAVFVSYHQYKDETKTIVSSGFWFLVYWSAFLLGLCILFSHQISQITFGNNGSAFFLALAFTTAFFTLLINYSKAIFRLEFRAKTFAIVSAVNAILVTTFSIICVVWIRLGIVGYFLGTLIGTFLNFLLTVYLIRANLSFKWSWKRAKEMAIYGSMLVPASISYFVFNLSDRFFVKYYWSLGELGLYSIALNIVALIQFFSMALSRAWVPMVFKLYFEEKDVFDEFVPRIFVYYLIFFFFLAVWVTLFGLEILKVLTVPEFYDSARAIGPLALAMAFSATVQITSLGMYIMKKTKLIVLCSAMSAAINLIFNFLLIPKFGMIGAGWATAISYIFLTWTYFFFSQKNIYLKINWFKVIKLFILAFGFIILAPYSWRFGFFTNLLMKIGETVTFGISLYVLNLIEFNEINSLKKFFFKENK